MGGGYSMKKFIIILMSLCILGCDEDTSYKYYYPDADTYGLKLYAMLLTVHENFVPGVYTHISMRSDRVRHYQTSRYKTVAYTDYVDVSGYDLIRPVSVAAHTERLVSFSSLYMLPAYESPYGLSHGHSHSLPSHVSSHSQFAQVGGSFSGSSFYPRSIGYGSQFSAPIALAYYPSGGFSGSIPSYTVDPFGYFARPRIFNLSFGLMQLFLDVQEKIYIDGDVNFLDTVTATINRVTIYDVYDKYSEMEFEIYPTPFPIF
jgi:hypothetical protein